ncbi:MAG: hypothetical protein AAFZ17_00715 [Cyanobacteria bacterium J06650_10]
MGRTLYEVVPGCMNEGFVEAMASKFPKPFSTDSADENEGTYLVHFESGKRVYQLYAELDEGDDANANSLAQLIARRYGNANYLGSWALQTMGGAAGQTVFGALTTGTHGGDIYFPPMADAVVAMHLVADGGKHYWIESEPAEGEYPLTDDNALISLYSSDEFGGLENFEIIRDDEIFNAVLVSAGRFGIVYSVVMRCVRQYSLHEERRLHVWQDIKQKLKDPSSDLYRNPSSDSYRQRFLQIAVCLTPHKNFKKNLCGVTKRWNVPLAQNPDTLQPIGRAERRGSKLDSFDSRSQSPFFENAGNSIGYVPDPEHPHQALPANFLEKACANADFIEGIVETVHQEIVEFVENNTVAVGSAIAAVTVVAGVGVLLAIAAVLIAVAAALLSWLDGKKNQGGINGTLGQTLNEIKDLLLKGNDSDEMTAGLFIWQCIAYKIFESEQSDLDFEAISYAVMDRHNYLDQSCEVDVDSIEVFFDATDPMLVAFIDALIAFEIRQEYEGKAMLGYASLRFMGKTQALLGMQKYPLTCAVEVAGLKDVSGSKELVDFAIACARDKNFRGILHWGQRNESTMSDIQDRFGDALASPSGALSRWRNSLSRITDNGRLDGFSSKFTRRVGLEIVSPRVEYFKSNTLDATLGELIELSWDCSSNPAHTKVILEAFGIRETVLPLFGSRSIEATQRGSHQIALNLSLELNGEMREQSETLIVVVV